jgi:large subunit ribosomal protein L32e
MNETEKKRLLRVRKIRSQNRPKFYAFESWRFIKIKERWRRPRGIDNKMRTNEKGWPKVANIGWGGPKKVRGLHPSGKIEILIYQVTDLNDINPETHVARIGGKVGGKKRVSIIEEARKRGVLIVNPGESEEKSDFEKLEDEKE